MESRKKCIACFIEKPIFDFSKDKYLISGYKGKCKECVKNKVNAYQTKEGFKICTVCLENKEESDFTKNRCRKDGLEPSCKDCNTSDEIKAKKADYYIKNKEKIKTQQKQNYILKKDEYLLRASNYYLNNEEKVIRKSGQKITGKK